MPTAVSFHTLQLLAAQLLQEPPRQLRTTAQHSSADSSDPPSHPMVHQRAPQNPGACQLLMAQARVTQQVLSQCPSSQAHLCGCDGHGQISEQGLNAHL